jgi:hypothetical protein
VPYAKVPHATIKARTITAVPIVNQKSRWRPVPGAAFHDLLRCPVRCWMPLQRGGFLCWRAGRRRRRQVYGTVGQRAQEGCRKIERNLYSAGCTTLSYIELGAKEDDEGQRPNLVENLQQTLTFDSEL